jgi:hypothetical protein
LCDKEFRHQQVFAVLVRHDSEASWRGRCLEEIGGYVVEQISSIQRPLSRMLDDWIICKILDRSCSWLVDATTNALSGSSRD